MKNLLFSIVLALVCVNKSTCQITPLFVGEKDTIIYTFCPMNEIQRDTLPKKLVRKCHDQIIINGRAWVVKDKRGDHNYVTKNQATFNVWTYATLEEKKPSEKNQQWVKMYGTLFVTKEKAMLFLGPHVINFE